LETLSPIYDTIFEKQQGAPYMSNETPPSSTDSDINLNISDTISTESTTPQKKVYKKPKGYKPLTNREGTKAKVSNYKRKGVSYGSPPPPLAMKVNATYHDKRMLDEASRSPLHKTASTKKRKYTLVPADYKPTILTTPLHLAHQEHQTAPTPTPEQIYLDSITTDIPKRTDPQCYKVEFPDSMKPEQTAQEQAAHEYYLHHTAATREAARHTEAKRTEEALTVMAAPKNHLQPNDIAIMRSQVFATVATQTQKVVGVLNGTEQWNPQQVRLYGMLLNKVLPDLHHSYSEVALQDGDVNKLSRKELEDIISSSNNTTAAQDIVEEDYRPSFDHHPHPDPSGPVIITHTKTED
jgi:hypothetical protein